jgi:hypothetical protein
MVTKSNLMRPELVKQIVNNHRDVYERYVDEVLYEKERKILLLKQARKKIQDSKSYKIGQWIVHPFRQMKKFVNPE